jgi:hypothetical protein
VVVRLESDADPMLVCHDLQLTSFIGSK